MSAEARTELVLPELSEGMQEGVLLDWLVEDGATVAAGEPLAEVETDKATTELEASIAGVVSHRVPAGSTVPVGDVIAVIGPDHEPASDVEPVAAPAAPASTRPVEASPSAGSAAAVGLPPAADPRPDAASVDAGGGPASPLARRIAREHGIDLRGVVGSGPRGRIVRSDVELLVADAASARVPLSRIQRAIVRRMVQAQETIPDFSISTVVAMDAAVSLREQLRVAADRSGERVPSYNDMVIKACALALREFPFANGTYEQDEFVLHPRVNVGMAVAADGALVVPTVFDADRASLAAIGGETRRLAGKVRDRSVAAEELQGGTFTVSNLGMFGVSRFVAVVNPPQAGILAVGELAEVPVVRSGAVVVGQRMELTLSCDHRILYGATAASFLARVRELLEAPALLLG